MSFLTDPDLYDYAIGPNICNACYDIGKSPDQLFLAVQGILTGQAWLPADPPPPNGLYQLSPAAACWWSLLIGIWDIQLQTNLPQTRLIITGVPALTAFTKVTPAACTNWLASEITDGPLVKYYTGEAAVVPPLPGGADSIQDLMQSLAMDPYSKHWCNPRPSDDDATVYTISSHINKTNIKIKQQTP